MKNPTYYCPSEPFVAAAKEWIARDIGRRRAQPFQWPTPRSVPLHEQALRELAERAHMGRHTLAAMLDGARPFIDEKRADRLALAMNIPLRVLAEDFRPMADWQQELAA